MKIKYKKIRGENRRLKAIERWIKSNEQLDINYLKQYGRDYVKFWVRPWSDLSVTNSIIPQPQGIYRERFLEGLAYIYGQWKNQLDNLNQPYYLKIWLFENELSRSQVVCAIGDNLHFYDNTFESVEQISTPSQLLNFNQNEQHAFCKFNWIKTQEIDVIFDDYVALPSVYPSYQDYLNDKAWFESLEKTVLKKVYVDNSNAYYYVIAKGTVWLGEST